MDIILISSKENKRINLHIKFGFVIIIGLALVVSFGLLIYNIIIFTSYKVEQKRLAQLDKENTVVRQEIARIEQEFSELNILIDSLEQYDKRLRTYASLEPINEDLRKMGIGGRSSSYDKMELPPDLSSNLAELSQNLDNILARSKFQKESFSQLMSHLEGKKHLRDHTPSIVPVQGWFISGFGYRIDPFTGKVKMHEGLDIAAPPGTPIVSPADGVVRSISTRKGFGLTIEIDHGYGFTTLYAHCMRTKVGVNAKVKRGDIIAYVGTTGKTTGPHLHYEVRISQVPVNPINYIITSSIID